jgi:hypothetical protein
MLPVQITKGLAECVSQYFFKGIQLGKVSQMFGLGFVMHSTSCTIHQSELIQDVMDAPNLTDMFC